MQDNNILFDAYKTTDCTEEDYMKLPMYIDQAKDFARITASCVFLMDFCKGSIPFVSSHMLDRDSLFQLRKDIYKYFSSRMLYEDVQKFKEVIKQTFNFIHSCPREDRKSFSLSFDFYVIENNIKCLMFRHITPLALTSNGNIWLTLGTLSPSGNTNPSPPILRYGAKNKYYEYSMDDHSFIDKSFKILDNTERKILFLSAQGCKVDEIAKIVYKSLHTIKSRKQQLFHKLEANNIADAMTKARNLMLF